MAALDADKLKTWTGVCAFAALVGVQPTAAQAAFPAALDPATVIDWLRRQTDASPEQVVAISPSVATRILAVEQIGPDRRRVLVDAQALDAQTVARSGVLAWRMTLEADCALGRVRVGPTTGYASRRAVGPGVPLRPADSDWRLPPLGSHLDSLRKAACLAPPRPAAPSPALLAKARSERTPSKASQPVPVIGQAQPASTDVAVQVISSPDKAETEAAVARMVTSPGELQVAVAPATVHGAITYRGLVTGFASRDAADLFCTELKAARQACFVRQAPARGRPLKPVATR